MYGKVFSSLWHGSLLGKGLEQLVFVLLIAHSDRDGNSEAHPAEIATWTGFSLAEIDTALAALQAEDPESRTDDEAGKRIIRAGLNLWHIVNYKKYLALQDRDVLRENGRERVRRSRAKKRAVTLGNASVTDAFVKGEVEVEREVEKTPAVVVALPTNRKDEETPITEAQAFEFQSLYPAVDVLKELRAMRAWLIANPAGRKTGRGMLRFVNGWLSRTQDRPTKTGMSAAEAIAALRS